MRIKSGFFIVVVLMLSLSACEDNKEETVPKVDYDAVVSELESTKSELKQLQNEVTTLQEELQVLKESIEESEEILKTKVDDLQEEGLTIATEPIIVPDPTTQSEFVVEITAENFLSIFEFIAINEYNRWGEYKSSKKCGFSSLLYEQGWAIGKIDNFAVEYSVFGYPKTTETHPINSAVSTGVSNENAEMDLRIYRVEGTITFYPVKDVRDKVFTSIEYDHRTIDRTLPDGSVITIYTDVDGIMVY